ncbi:MAG: RNA polymerase sigma factor, partial [Armatimonadetes bacterium]|nr:RNA polymerase sigma factor [Armatimonadota bacterium]
MAGGVVWDSLEDEDLVLAAAVGQMEAFDALVGRYRRPALAVAGAIVGARRAEDVVQDALLLAFKALPQLEDPARFGAWLASITRYRALRVARGAERREETGHSALDQAILGWDSEKDPGALAETAVLQRDVAEALERLPEEIQVPVRLHYFEYMAAREIAEFLDLPLSTVKWRLHRGRTLLREELRDAWAETEPAGRPLADSRGDRKGQDETGTDLEGGGAPGAGRRPAAVEGARGGAGRGGQRGRDTEGTAAVGSAAPGHGTHRTRSEPYRTVGGRQERGHSELQCYPAPPGRA